MDAELTLQTCRDYLKDLKAKGRKFNPIKFKITEKNTVREHGCCHYLFETQGYDLIEINPNIQTYEEMRNTVIHELAHADLYARRDGHRSKWKQVARLYSRWYKTNITTYASGYVKKEGTFVLKFTITEAAANKYNIPRTIERNYVKKGAAINYINRRRSLIEDYEIIEL